MRRWEESQRRLPALLSLILFAFTPPQSILERVAFATTCKGEVVIYSIDTEAVYQSDKALTLAICAILFIGSVGKDEGLNSLNLDDYWREGANSLGNTMGPASLRAPSRTGWSVLPGELRAQTVDARVHVAGR